MARETTISAGSRNIKITIQYDGTAYQGWQRQAVGATIQEILEKAAATIFQQPVHIAGSGRTDAGVHALKQVANFKVDSALPLETVLQAMNSLLPRDIAITDAEEKPPSFHARYDALSKAYQYRIHNGPLRSPFLERYCWHIRRALDSDTMAVAADLLRGRHDFSAFQSSGSDRKTAVRTITKAAILREGQNGIIFEIEGDGFLRYMVRAIVGTLVDVGRGKSTPDDFRAILESKNRGRAGATAPPQGLFLKEVRYR